MDNTKKVPVLKVKGGNNPTDPVGLSRSILHVLKENEHVELLTVGDPAFKIAMTAFRLASDEVKLKTNAVMLVNTQNQFNANIDGNRAKGVNIRVFPIPIKYAL
jgi:stage V sporulation protein SpoVS